MKRDLPWITAAGALLSLCAGLAQAQPMYRIVGPDGRVTFSDRPPVEGAAPPATPGTGRVSAANAGAGLPYELGQVAGRYPVTLYTGPNCAPCEAARNLLINRGVPFSERTVTSNDDVEALQRLNGEATLPYATIGAQQLKGFLDVEWSQYLDAAGYPKTSELPSNYRRPAATPLVAAKRAEPATAAPAGAAPTAAPAAAATTPPVAPPNRRTGDNPAGIRF